MITNIIPSINAAVSNVALLVVRRRTSAAITDNAAENSRIGQNTEIQSVKEFHGTDQNLAPLEGEVSTSSSAVCSSVQWYETINPTHSTTSSETVYSTRFD